MKKLDIYPYAGHSALIGKMALAWQNTSYILGLFGEKVSPARRQYRAFVEKGIADGKRPELTGGGLIRSVGGWAAAKALRKANALQKGDERILGDGDFVETVLSEANEAYERKYRLKAKGFDVDTVAQKAAQVVGIEPSQVWLSGKNTKVVQARSLLCYWATSELGVSQAWLSKKLKLSQPAISLSVARGRSIANKNNYLIENL
jgi:putative transposase